MTFKTLSKTFLAVGLLTLSSTSFSTGVMQEMFQMKKELNTLNASQTNEEFETAAQHFIEYSQKAKETMPNSLDNDQERFAGYQAGIQEVIDVVAKAKEQAKAGKLAEAKEIISQLNDMKKKYHMEYK